MSKSLSRKRFISLDSIGCSFDSDDIFRVSSICVPLWQRYGKMSQFLHVNDEDDDNAGLRQCYSNTSGFLRKQPSCKSTRSWGKISL